MCKGREGVICEGQEGVMCEGREGVMCEGQGVVQLAVRPLLTWTGGDECSGGESGTGRSSALTIRTVMRQPRRRSTTGIRSSYVTTSAGAGWSAPVRAAIPLTSLHWPTRLTSLHWPTRLTSLHWPTPLTSLHWLSSACFTTARPRCDGHRRRRGSPGLADTVT